MRHLVVYSHPNPKSFNCAIKETFKEALENKGHEVRVRDLYALGFDPVLRHSDFEALAKGSVLADVKTEQDHLNWAEMATFIFPIWWTGLPSMMKGYIDRVFSHGFAYVTENGAIKKLLTGKKALIINTTGSPKEIYEATGMYKSLRQTSDEGIFAFCGIEVAGHKFFSGVPFISDVDRKAMLEEVKEIAARI